MKEFVFPHDIWVHHIYPELPLWNLMRRHVTTSRPVIEKGNRIIDKIVTTLVPKSENSPSRCVPEIDCDFIENNFGEEYLESFMEYYRENYEINLANHLGDLDTKTKEKLVFYIILYGDDNLGEVIHKYIPEDCEEKKLLLEFLKNIQLTTRKHAYTFFTCNQLTQLEQKL